MKRLMFAALVPLALGACSSGKDTGDTGGLSGTPVIDAIGWQNCTPTGSCTWFVTAVGGHIGTVELWLSETGDTVSPNIWEEYHNDFDLVESTGSYETKAITLTVVDDFEQQTQNVSTLFDMNAEETAQLTYYFRITDSAGDYADCAVGGHDPTYFGSQCANNANNW